MSNPGKARKGHCSTCGSSFHDKRFHKLSKAERMNHYKQMAAGHNPRKRRK